MLSALRTSQPNWEQERPRIQEASEIQNYKDGMHMEALGWRTVTVTQRAAWEEG